MLQTAAAPLRDSVYAALQADATLRTGGASGAPLLALDPANITVSIPGNPTAPALAILPSRLSDIASPVYPCVTYRVSITTPVKAFEDATPGLPSAPVDDLRMDMEVWAGTSSNTSLVDTVLAVIESHFRNQALALTGGAINGGNACCFRGVQLTSQPDLYNKDLKAWYGCASYLFRIQR